MEHIVAKDFKLNNRTAVTIGNFDGIHLGHKKLIETCKYFAEHKSLKSVVLSFNPHPMFVVGGQTANGLVMSYDEKLYELSNMHIDYYVEYPFDLDFASISAHDFVREILVKRLNCDTVILGEDYKFGKNGVGNIDYLKEISKEYSFNVEVVYPVVYDNMRVSSTRVRKALKDKDLEYAANLMAHPFFVMGEVQVGKKIGRTISFPTINLIPNHYKILPGNGVYATRTLFNNKIYDGVTNIGTNPTVNGNIEHKTIETNLFNFDKILYGESVVTMFYKWIRNEQRFNSLDELRVQIEEDSRLAKDYLHQIIYK